MIHVLNTENPDPSEEKRPEEPSNVLQAFLLEQLRKLSSASNLGLNSKIKRTFIKP